MLEALPVNISPRDLDYVLPVDDSDAVLFYFSNTWAAPPTRVGLCPSAVKEPQ